MFPDVRGYHYSEGVDAIIKIRMNNNNPNQASIDTVSKASVRYVDTKKKKETQRWRHWIGKERDMHAKSSTLRGLFQVHDHLWANDGAGHYVKDAYIDVAEITPAERVRRVLDKLPHSSHTPTLVEGNAGDIAVITNLFHNIAPEPHRGHTVNGATLPVVFCKAVGRMIARQPQKPEQRLKYWQKQIRIWRDIAESAEFPESFWSEIQHVNSRPDPQTADIGDEHGSQASVPPPMIEAEVPEEAEESQRSDVPETCSHGTSIPREAKRRKLQTETETEGSRDELFQVP